MQTEQEKPQSTDPYKTLYDALVGAVGQLGQKDQEEPVTPQQSSEQEVESYLGNLADQLPDQERQ